jgi:hypothetical protein
MFNGEEEEGTVGLSVGTSDPSRTLALRVVSTMPEEWSAGEPKACGTSVHGGWSVKKLLECESLDGFASPMSATSLFKDSLQRSL